MVGTASGRRRPAAASEERRRRRRSGDGCPVGTGCHQACHRFRLISIYLLDIAFAFASTVRRNQTETPTSTRIRHPRERVTVPTGAAPATSSPGSARSTSRASSRSTAAPGWPSWPRGSASRRSRSARTSRRSSARAALVRTHGGAIAVDRGRRRSARSTSASGSSRTRRRGSARPRPRSSHDGESIVMDASTTALAVARHLKARGGWSQPDGHHQRPADRLRAGRLTRASASLMLGGRVRWEALSVVGPARRRPVRAGSTSRRRSSAPPASRSRPGLSDATDEEAQIKRSMVAARARGHRASSTTRSGSAPRSRRSARRPSIDVVLTDAGAPRGDGRGAPPDAASRSASSSERPTATSAGAARSAPAAAPRGDAGHARHGRQPAEGRPRQVARHRSRGSSSSTSRPAASTSGRRSRSTG